MTQETLFDATLRAANDQRENSIPASSLSHYTVMIADDVLSKVRHKYARVVLHVLGCRPHYLQLYLVNYHNDAPCGLLQVYKTERDGLVVLNKTIRLPDGTYSTAPDEVVAAVLKVLSAPFDAEAVRREYVERCR